MPSASLVVERLHGREAVSALFHFNVDCLSTSAHLALKTLIGEEVSLRLLQADGSTRAWHGLVTRSANLGGDGALTRYRLTLQPWLALLGLRLDSFIFQDLSVLDIAAAIFADYPQASFRIDAQPVPTRSLTIQYRETDLAFLSRLLAEEGLS